MCFLLLAAPGVDVDDEAIIPKDVILVFDRSGSMGSDNKIEQARSALLDVVGRLNPEDRFNIVTFSSTAESFSPELLPATDTGNTSNAHPLMWSVLTFIAVLGILLITRFVQRN